MDELLRRLLGSAAIMPMYAPPGEGGEGDGGDEGGEGTGDGNGSEGDGAAGQDDGDDEGGDDDDDAEVSAEHSDDAEDDGEPEVDVRPRSRGESRQQRLSNENRELRERSQRIENEMAEMRRQTAAREQQQQEAQERDRLQYMTPEERIEYRMQRMEQSNQQSMQRLHMQTQLQMDKAAYDAKAAVNSVYRKHQAEVERRHAQQLNAGRPVEREILLKLIIGEKSLESAEKSTTRAQRNGARRVAAQTVRGGNSRSDATRRQERSGNTAETRLKDQYI